MKNIKHLPEMEQQHYILCDCGEYVDMRNLSEVFRHLHANLPDPEWSHAVKKGEPTVYSKSGKRLGLN
jgi:hypothetical protein